MFPNRSGQLPLRGNFEHLVKIMLDRFTDGRPLKLKNEKELQEWKFRLEKRNQIFNPFERKLILAEIKGQIVDHQISYQIGMSVLMKLVFWIDSMALLFLTIWFLSEGEFETGFMVLGFIVLMALIIYFWLLSDLNYLENRFKEQVNA